MPTVVEIPEVGEVEFPDSMTEEQVASAAGDLHKRAMTGKSLRAQKEAIPTGEPLWGRAIPEALGTQGARELGGYAVQGLTKPFTNPIGAISDVGKLPFAMANEVINWITEAAGVEPAPNMYLQGPEFRPVQVGRMEVNEDDGTIEEIAKGLVNAGAGAVEAIASPEGLGVLAAAPFAPHAVVTSALAAETPKVVEATAEAAGRGDVAGTTEQIATGAMMVAPAALGAWRSRVDPVGQRATAYEIDRLAREGMRPPELTQAEITQTRLMREGVPPQSAKAMAEGETVIRQAMGMKAITGEFPKAPGEVTPASAIGSKRITGEPIGLEALEGTWPPTAEQLGTFRSKGPTPHRESTMRAEPERLPVSEQPPAQTRTPEPIKPAAKPSEQTEWGLKDNAAPETAVKPSDPTRPPSDLFKPESLTPKADTTVGVTPTIAGIPLGSLERGWSWMKSMVKTHGNLPKDIAHIWESATGSKSKAGQQIEWARRNLENALRKQYKISRLSMLGGGSKRIPPDAVKLMDQAYKGDIAAINALPPEIRGAITEMRTLTDKYSGEVIRELLDTAGRMPPAKRGPTLDLIQTIQNNMDVYAHRSYKWFDAPDTAPQWYKQLNPKVRADAENFLIQNSPTPLTVPEAQSLAMRFLDDLKADSTSGIGSKIGSKDSSIFMKRNVIAPEIRALLGEHQSPLVNFSRSVGKMASWVAHQKFLKNTRDIGMGKYFFEDNQAPPGFSTRIASAESDAMSPLNGLRTTPEIAQAFKIFSGDQGTASRFWRIYHLFNAQTKFAATGQSWMTQQRNLWSRIPMAIMAGHWHAARYFPEAVKATWAELASKNPSPATRAYVERLHELGLVEGALSGEMRAIMRDAALQDTVPADMAHFSVGRAIKEVGWTIPGKVYRASDMLGNIMGWEAEKVFVRKKYPRMSEREVEAAAAETVKQIYPFYSRTPEAIQSLRKVPLVGTFATFSYHAVRNTANIAKLAISELRSTDPNIRAVGTIRLSGFMAAKMLPYAMQEYSKFDSGISAQEEEDFRLFRQEYDKNAAYLFMGKDKDTGEISVANLSNFFPSTYDTDPIMAIVSAARGKKPADEAAIDAITEFLRPYVGEQILLGSLADVARNKTKYGYEVFNETDGWFERQLKKGWHVTKTLRPGTINRVDRRIIPALRGEQPAYGAKLEPTREIARELTGVSFEKFNYGTGFYNRSRETSYEIDKAMDTFTSPLYRPTTISEDDIFENYVEADRKRFMLWQTQRKMFLAAMRGGVSKREAVKLMTERGWSKAHATDIAKGTYSPYDVSGDMVNDAKKRNHSVPMQRIRGYMRTVANTSLDNP